MPESRESASSKCFSAVLSRLLCSGGLPTHPSEQLIEPRIEKKQLDFPIPTAAAEEENQNARRSSSPGVVARLMGLESFPAQIHGKERTLGDFFRSRSVNSIDFLSHFDPIKSADHRRHRRIRTSVSFREGVSVSDDFASVILLLEEEFQAKIGENVEIEEKRKSLYGRNVEIKEKRKKKKDLKGKRRVDLKERRPVMKGEEELKKKRKKKSKILAHHNLSFDLKKIHPQGTAPEVARIASPRKHRPSKTANSQPRSSCSNSSFSDNVEVIPIGVEKNEGKMSINDDFCYKNMVEQICMLTEESLGENWNYGIELKFDNSEGICQQFGQEILEVLLTQIVDEFVLYFGKKKLYVIN